MQAFFVSLWTVAIAEIGDRTQLLALLLAARYRKPWQILAGILIATLANHAAAAAIGRYLGDWLTPARLDLAVGVCFIAMALWALKPDSIDEEPTVGSRGAFAATLAAFFVAEIGDKTQIATMALAAGYSSMSSVVAGSTLGLFAVNAPVVFLGGAFANRLPLKGIRIAAAAIFLLLGIVFVARAIYGKP